MIASLIGAAAGKFGAGAIEDYFNKQAAERSFKNNLKLQQNDQAFQKEMRETQYQTTVEDMQKAGINPAVALSGGASLSSQGGGSSASASAPSGSNGNIAETMMSLKSTQSQIENQTALTNADVTNKNAETIKTLTDAGYSQEQIKTAEKERNLIIQEIENAKSKKALIEAETKLKEWEARNPIWSKILPATGAVAGATIGAIAAGPIGAGIGFGIGHGFRRPNPIGFNK